MILMASSMGTVKDTELNGRTFLVLHEFSNSFAALAIRGEVTLPTILAERKGRNPTWIPLFAFWNSSRNERHNSFVLVTTIDLFCCTLPFKTLIFLKCSLSKTFSSRLIRFLVEAYPESVTMRDEKGKHPLHVAVEHYIPGHESIVEAEPRALETRCMVTRMCPFQLLDSLQRENGEMMSAQSRDEL